MLSAYMESLKDRQTLNKSETKILKSKGPRMEPWRTPERMARVDEKRGKGLYTRTCCVQFVRNKQISEREWERPHNFSLSKSK